MEFINKTIIRGEKTDLDNIRKVLGALGDPHLKIKTVHITGTNGKGSTAAFAASILTELGYKTALFTSPHLIDVRERIKINGENIGRQEFCAAVGAAAAAYEALKLEPSFFELMLVVAALHFYAEKCDFVIAEVGIGGRLDSTNVLNGAVCSITGVDFDHIEYLGGTLREIAREKTAIVKPGSVLTVNVEDDGLYDFIEKEALERKAARVTRIGKLVGGRVLSVNTGGTDFVVDSPSLKEKRFHAPLIGDYQFQNARCAIGIIEELQAAGLIKIDCESVTRGFAKTFWPGRFELFKKDGAFVVLDGAHNVNGMTGFVRNLKTLFGGLKIRAIISILSNKQYDQMLGIISGAVDEIIVVGINNIKKKSVEVSSLVENARKYHDNVICLSDVKTALQYASKAGNCDLSCVTGSLYLVGEARERLLSWSGRYAGKVECVNYESCFKA